MKILKDQKFQALLAQFFELARFGIVGVGATLTHLGVAYLLASHSEMPLVICNTMAFGVAFIVSFLGHYHWTFKPAGPARGSLFKFFAVAVLGLIASNILLFILVELNIANDFTKLLISIFIIPIVSYILSKCWAFRNAKGNYP